MSDMSFHETFYLDTVTFCVEGCLFKVPRGPFETESIVFRDMFLLPTGDLHEEGKSDKNPIHLQGVTEDDFGQLLSVLLYRPYTKAQQPFPETDDEWKTVLRLAGLWGFDTIRQVAMDHLRDSLSAIDKIILGETYDLDFESWSLPAMHEIVRRHKPISVDESKRMGLEMTLKLASVRERVTFHQRFISSAWEPAAGRRPDVETVDFSRVLREVFKPSSK